MFIRRFPPAHEQSMWPDTLPASMVVPTNFTLFVPGDLDLSETDLTVHGTVTLPPAPPGAASESEAGLVELATQAEVDAGTDALRVVTPATLTAWSGAGGSASVVFDDCAFSIDGTAASDQRVVSIALTLDGVAISEQIAIWVAVVRADDDGLHDQVVIGSISTLRQWQPDGTSGKLLFGVSETDGTFGVRVVNGTGSTQQFRLAVTLPTGAVKFSEAYDLGVFAP